MSQENGHLQIGEFARLANTNLRTLRYYEELGLIEPVSRSEGGFRYYSPQQVDRVLAIKRLQNLGLSLREIRTYVVDRADCSHEQHLARIAAALERQGDLLQERISEMEADLDCVRQAQVRLEECRTCGRELDPATCDPCSKTDESLPPVLRALL